MTVGIHRRVARKAGAAKAGGKAILGQGKRSKNKAFMENTDLKGHA